MSVIVPCFNSSATLDRAAESIQKQTIKPREVIFVNDASNDGGATTRKLKSIKEMFAEINEVIVVKIIELEKNNGPAGARNIAWNQAQAEYVAFLDADDAWHSQKLELQYNWMKIHPEVAMSGHRYTVVACTENEGVIEQSVLARDYSFFSLLFKNAFSTPTVMVKRQIDLRFPVDMRYSEDYMLWLSISAAGNKLVILDCVLAYLFKPTYGAGGLSSDLWDMEQGVQLAYTRLYQSRQLNFFSYLFFRMFSLMKYIRRVLLVSLRE